jgi:hypothetical protein
MCMKRQDLSSNPRSGAETCGLSQDRSEFIPRGPVRKLDIGFPCRPPRKKKILFSTFEAVMYMKTNKSTSVALERRSYSSPLPFGFSLLTCSSPRNVFRIAHSGFRQGKFVLRDRSGILIDFGPSGGVRLHGFDLVGQPTEGPCAAQRFALRRSGKKFRLSGGEA